MFADPRSRKFYVKSIQLFWNTTICRELFNDIHEGEEPPLPSERGEERSKRRRFNAFHTAF